MRGIRVAARDRDRAQGLAAELTRELGVDARAVSDYEEAVRGADLVAATTHSPEPVVQREWLTPGAHITSVGVNPHGRELAGEVVCDALVVVESRAAALAPFPGGSNDLLWPIRDGLIDEAHIHAELGEIVAGSKPGRTSPEQITLYKVRRHRRRGRCGRRHRSPRHGGTADSHPLSPSYLFGLSPDQ